MAWRMWRHHDLRLLAKLGRMGWHNLGAIRAFQKRLRRGEHFPAFLFVSVTNKCNLNCQGCWVHKSSPPVAIAPEALDKLIVACKSQGSRFFGILGGEPLQYEGLFDIIACHPDCYFQIFTNGLLLDDAVAARMRELGNITPLISVEGLEQVSDQRRGGQSVFARTMAGLETARRHRLVTGVATSVCASNIDDLASDAFVERVSDLGVAYLWYYIYRPVGAQPHPELCLTRDQVRDLRRFIVEVRTRTPMMIVDAYWDHDGNALCPAAVGISHHISPAGDIEPCPPIQFAAETIGDGSEVVATVQTSDFLRRFRETVTATTRGCIILDDPERLARLVEETGAYDSSGRDVGTAEMRALCCNPSHDLGDEAIPERSWAYRFAKKNWFFGFGAYG